MVRQPEQLQDIMERWIAGYDNMGQAQRDIDWLLVELVRNAQKLHAWKAAAQRFYESVEYGESIPKEYRRACELDENAPR